MKSLKDLTLDYLSKNMPEDLLDELGKKVLNKYYTCDGKEIDLIVGIDDDAIFEETGEYFVYWLWKYCPQYFFAINNEQLSGHINGFRYGKNGTKYVYLRNRECNEEFYEPNINKTFFQNFNDYVKEKRWIDMSSNILHSFPDNIIKYIVFKKFREDCYCSNGVIWPIEPLHCCNGVSPRNKGSIRESPIPKILKSKI